MTYENEIKLVFSSLLESNFTLGKLNDGFPSPTLSQDMTIKENIVSPLTLVGNQTLIIGQDETFVDWLKTQSIAGSLAANPSGGATASVVWTNYDLKLRFGLSASISATRWQAVKAAAESIIDIFGTASAPAPTLTWSYMLDCAPDQPVEWIEVTSPNTAITRNFPCNPAYQLWIQPVIGTYTINVAAQVQPSTNQ